MTLESEIIKHGGVPEGYEPIDVEFFRFHKHGDKVVGQLLLKKPITVTDYKTGNKNVTQKYRVRRDDGSETSFIGNIQLDDKMAYVNPGKYVYIEYINDVLVEGTTNQMKEFLVAVKNK